MDKRYYEINVRKDDVMKKLILRTFLSTLTIVIFLMLWQAAVVNEFVPTNKIVSPEEVFDAFRMKIKNPAPDGATVQAHLGQSLKILLLGWLAGSLVGAILGLLMGWYKIIDYIIQPVFELYRMIPAVAWIPIVSLWAGTGDKAKLAVIFFTSLIPAIAYARTGIIRTSKTLLSLATMYGASDFEKFTKVAIPIAMPEVLTGIKIALVKVCITLAVVEFLMSNSGIGYMINMGRRYQRIDIIILGMVVMGITAKIFISTIEGLEKGVLKISRK